MNSSSPEGPREGQRPLSLLLPPMPSAVVADDPAAFRVSEEDVLRLKLTELGAGLVVADAGALIVGQRAQANAEVRNSIEK